MVSKAVAKNRVQTFVFAFFFIEAQLFVFGIGKAQLIVQFHNAFFTHRFGVRHPRLQPNLKRFVFLFLIGGVLGYQLAIAEKLVVVAQKSVPIAAVVGLVE